MKSAQTANSDNAAISPQAIQEDPRDTDATTDPARARIALEAAWEIEALALSLVELDAKDNPDYSDFLRIRGMSLRIRDLIRTTMFVLDRTDESYSISELREQVRGVAATH